MIGRLDYDECHEMLVRVMMNDKYVEIRASML